MRTINGHAFPKRPDFHCTGHPDRPVPDDRHEITLCGRCVANGAFFLDDGLVSCVQCRNLLPGPTTDGRDRERAIGAAVTFDPGSGRTGDGIDGGSWTTGS